VVNRLNFEWDEQKNISNQKKHAVSFEEAVSVFDDERARLISDPDHSDEEDRFILLGMSSRYRLLTICHCERGADMIRIISARKADRFERKQYEGYSNA